MRSMLRRRLSMRSTPRSVSCATCMTLFVLRTLSTWFYCCQYHCANALFSDDDDDGDDGAKDTETKDASHEQDESEDVKPDVEMEDVKSEPDTPKSKLPVFTLEQLKKMKRRDLTADVQIWQGTWLSVRRGLNS